MLEELLIFTRGGLILWTCKEFGNALKGSPIDTLIRSCLLEERSASASYDYDAPSTGALYTLKWTFHNELNLVFVAVYQRILRLLYVDDLLAAVKREFAAVYDPKRVDYGDFGETFRQLQKEAEVRAEELRKAKQVTSKGLSGGAVKKQGQVIRNDGNQRSGSDSGSGKDDSDENSVKYNGMGNGNHHVGMNGNKESGAPGNVLKGKLSSNGGAFDVNKLQKLRSKGGKKTNTAVVKVSKGEPKKATKKNRVWDDSPVESQLDFTDPLKEQEEGNGEVITEIKGESLMDREEELSSDSDSDSDDEVKEMPKTTQQNPKKGWFTSVLQRY